MQFGVQLYSLREYIEENGLESAFSIVANAGFTGVEFAGFYGKSGAELQELLTRYNLRAVSAHVAAGEISTQLPVLKELGIKCSIIPYIPFNRGTSFEEGLADCVRSEKLLKDNGMRLGYHNHDHEFKDGADVVAKLAESIPELQLELDVFWLAVAGIDAIQYMQAHRDRLLYLHIKELGECADGVNPVVGDGKANLANVLGFGRELGLDWAILEAERIDLPMSEYLERSYAFMSKER